jgi:soluble lytic murein transglycosylase-like protein
MIVFLSMIPAPSAERSSSSKNQIAPLFTEEVHYWESKIVTWSDDWNLDPNFVATIMQIESCGDPKARSSAGAMGLFQVMPVHFSEDDDPYKPNVNARRGLAYMKLALDTRSGDPRLALAGYNGGITGAQRPESDWPSETIRYVYWGVGIYEDALNGKDTSDRLREWLAAGGNSLCNQAAGNLGLIP